LRILAIFGALALGALLIFAGAAGAIWYTKQQADGIVVGDSGPDSPAVPGVAASSPPVQAGGPAPGFTDKVGLEKVRSLLAVLDEERRTAIVDSEERFGEFVRSEAANQSVLTAAYANAADQQEAVRVLMERASEKILAEAYLNRIVRLNADPDFPAQADIKEFYERNQESFRLPDRIHIWQIFVPAPAEAPAEVVKKARAEVTGMVDSLRKGKADFASIARAHSRHVQSRLNDGYMGLLKMDELLPEVRAAVDNLKIGAISDPLRTAAGFHIIRRGASVPGSILKLVEVEEQIKQRLQQQAAQRIRRAAVDKIVANYPVRVPETALEDWRLKLRADGSKRSDEAPDTESLPSNENMPLAD
jgi:peptidylprolyl isomerase